MLVPLLSILVAACSAAHRNTGVWVDECYVDPDASSSAGVWTVNVSEVQTGTTFPFINISGACFGSESHALDPTTTNLVLEGVAAADFYIDIVTPTSISVVSKCTDAACTRAPWFTFTDPLITTHSLVVSSLTFDGYSAPTFAPTAVATIHPEETFYVFTRATTTNFLAKTVVVLGSGFAPPSILDEPATAATFVPIQLQLSGGQGTMIQDQHFKIRDVENSRLVLELLPGSAWGVQGGSLSVTKARHGGTGSSAWQDVNVAVATIGTGSVAVSASRAPLSMVAPFTIHGQGFGTNKEMLSIHFKTAARMYTTGTNTTAGCVSSGDLTPNGTLSGADQESFGLLGGRYIAGCESSATATTAHTCDMAFDGDDTTDWASAQLALGTNEWYGAEAWMKVNFSQRIAVSGIKYQQRSQYGHNRDIDLVFQDGSVQHVELRSSPRLETYYFRTRETDHVELRVKKTYEEFNQNGASQIEFVLCDLSQGKSRQRPLLAPRYAVDYLKHYDDYNITSVVDDTITLQPNPGRSWSPGGVVHDLQIEAIEVGDTGVIPMNVTVARLLPNASVVPRNWLIRSNTSSLVIHGHNFDTNLATFDIRLSSVSEGNFTVTSVTANSATLELKPGGSWLACSSTDLTCDPSCHKGSARVCVVRVTHISGFSGTLVVPTAEQQEVALVVSQMSMYSATGDLLYFDSSSTLGKEHLAYEDFRQFPETASLTNPVGFALDNQQQQLFILGESILPVPAEAPSGLVLSSHSARLAAFDISASAPALQFAKNLSSPVLSEPRGIALEHRRVCVTNVTVNATIADAAVLSTTSAAATLWKSQLRVDIARALGVSMQQLGIPTVSVVHPVIGESQLVDFRFQLTTLRQLDETAALAKLRAQTRDSRSGLNTIGMVTTNRTYFPDFEPSCELVKEEKRIFLSSSTAGCAQRLNITQPSAIASDATLSTATRAPRVQAHRQTCVNQQCAVQRVGGDLEPVVNVNTVSVADMVSNFASFGITEADATNMVDFRTTYGPFQRVSDLKALKNGVTILTEIKYDQIYMYLSVHRPRSCQIDDHCQFWDEQACFSEASREETSHASGIAVHSSDPDNVYLASEESGMVSQVDSVSGSLESWTPILGSHATALQVHQSEADLGPCVVEVNRELGICTKKLDGLSLTSTASYPREDVPCKQDAHCIVNVPEVIAAVEQAGTENFLFRSSHQGFAWTKLFKDDHELGPLTLAANLPICKANLGCTLTDDLHLMMYNGFDGPVFGSFLQDPSLSPPSLISAIHLHEQLGLLVSDQRRVIRYDSKTGKRLGVFADFGPDAKLTDFAFQLS